MRLKLLGLLVLSLGATAFPTLLIARETFVDPADPLLRAVDVSVGVGALSAFVGVALLVLRRRRGGRPLAIGATFGGAALLLAPGAALLALAFAN
jgi:hypothetical protein